MESEKVDMLELSQALSGISKNKPKAYFKIGYTETEGNIAIHKSFQEFCFYKANNEYLAGIGKLLEYASFIDLMMMLEARIAKLEQKAVEQTVVPEEPKANVVNGVKTF